MDPAVAEVRRLQSSLQGVQVHLNVTDVDAGRDYPDAARLLADLQGEGLLAPLTPRTIGTSVPVVHSAAPLKAQMTKRKKPKKANKPKKEENLYVWSGRHGCLADALTPPVHHHLQLSRAVLWHVLPGVGMCVLPKLVAESRCSLCPVPV